MAALSDSIHTKLGPEAQLLMLKSLINQDASVRCEELAGYLRYYHHEVRTLRLGQWTKTLTQESFLQSHKDVLECVSVIRAHPDSTRVELREMLRARSSTVNDTTLHKSMDFTLRIWLMINVRAFYQRLETPEIPVIIWRNEETPYQLVRNLFPVSKWTPGPRDSRLSPSFTADFMVSVCELELSWTDCLADHLRLDRRRKKLRIFPHKRFLALHRNDSTNS